MSRRLVGVPVVSRVSRVAGRCGTRKGSVQRGAPAPDDESMVVVQLFVALLTLALVVWGLRVLDEIDAVETVDMTTARAFRD